MLYTLDDATGSATSTRRGDCMQLPRRLAPAEGVAPGKTKMRITSRIPNRIKQKIYPQKEENKAYLMMRLTTIPPSKYFAAPAKIGRRKEGQ